ncbi:MAG: hypothetical protein GXP25_17720 [Planctomycetes bacterium]|nr:hypothetical protein [Planctomycetota bacterium]
MVRGRGALQARPAPPRQGRAFSHNWGPIAGWGGENQWCGKTPEEKKTYQRRLSPAEADAAAKAQLTKSLNHELTIRGLKQTDDMKFNITSLTIRKNYGIALAALGFVNFIYLDPAPAE